MIDSHTHLDRGPAPAAELVAAANAAGVRRILTIGLDSASCRAALAAAEAHPSVFAAVGRHPNETEGFDEGDADELAELARHPRCLAIGETGLDYYREGSPRRDQARAFTAHIALARATGKPLVVHTRDATEDTLATLEREAEGLTVIVHCFSMPDRVEECLAHPTWWLSFAGNVTYPRNEPLAAAADRVPLGRLLVETDAPYLTPQSLRKHRNQPAYVVHTAAFLAERRRIPYEELEAAVEANAAGLFGW
jgi:TatD DNase family protein